MKFIFFLLMFTSVAFAQEEDCLKDILGQEKELLTLIQTMKNDVLGGIPYFCRPDKKQLNDTDADVVLFKYLREVIDKAPKAEKINPDPQKVLVRVMQSTAIKSLWQVSSKELKYQMLLRESCFDLTLNKLPIESSEKEQLTSSEAQTEQDQKILKRLDNICGAKNLTDLLPYLSKDLILESMYYVSEMNPGELARNMDIVCNAAESATHITVDGVNDSTFYRKKDAKDVLSFSEWLKKLRPQISFDETLLSTYQGKAVPLAEILSENEVKALYDYTDVSYKEINFCLRKEDCSWGQRKTVKLIKSALKKIKASRGEEKERVTFRGAGWTPNLVKKILEEGSKNDGKAFVVDLGFMSTSGKPSVAAEFAKSPVEGSITYIINSKSCVGIAEISNVKSEDEFLCPPGLKFKISKPATLKNTYVLEEVEP